MHRDEFTRIIEPIKDRLFRYAYLKVNDRQDAEDILQETLLKLWTMRSSLRSYRSIEALALRITSNLCIDHFRKVAKVFKSELIWPQEEFCNGEKVLIENEDLERLQMIFKGLKEPYYTVLFLRAIEQKSIAEIAASLDIKKNTVEVTLSRARKKIHQQLKSNKL